MFLDQMTWKIRANSNRIRKAALWNDRNHVFLCVCWLWPMSYLVSLRGSVYGLCCSPPPGGSVDVLASFSGALVSYLGTVSGFVPQTSASEIGWFWTCCFCACLRWSHPHCCTEVNDKLNSDRSQMVLCNELKQDGDNNRCWRGELGLAWGLAGFTFTVTAYCVLHFYCDLHTDRLVKYGRL